MSKHQSSFREYSGTEWFLLKTVVLNATDFIILVDLFHVHFSETALLYL